MNEGKKKWYTSKTLWANTIMIIAIVIQAQFGFILGGEEQIAILAVINILLRIKTEVPLSFRAD